MFQNRINIIYKLQIKNNYSNHHHHNNNNNPNQKQLHLML